MPLFGSWSSSAASSPPQKPPLPAETHRDRWSAASSFPGATLARVDPFSQSRRPAASPVEPGETTAVFGGFSSLRIKLAPPKRRESSIVDMAPPLQTTPGGPAAMAALKDVAALHRSATSASTSSNASAATATNPSGTATAETKMIMELSQLSNMVDKFDKFRRLLEEPTVDLVRLRKLAWHGIPEELRPKVWQLLLGYLPANSDRREQVLARKRAEYREYVAQSFGQGPDALDAALHHQIHVDVLRPQVSLPLLLNSRVQDAFERILYCWAIRHPASGYVQGINDLIVPFFVTFLRPAQAVLASSDAPASGDPALLLPDDSVLGDIEADTFWALCKLLDAIQDNYTFAQPGIQRQVAKLKELVGRIDAPLCAHLEREGIDFIQFAFRWMNCLLMRELSLANTVRMWDTYQAEGADSFFEFHLYVCAAFLVKWTDTLCAMEFQDMMIFLQNLPTKDWGEKDMEILLSEAFMWKSLFHNAPKHLEQRAGGSGSPGRPA